jgi:hypothetical protein
MSIMSILESDWAPVGGAQRLHLHDLRDHGDHGARVVPPRGIFPFLEPLSPPLEVREEARPSNSPGRPRRGHPGGPAAGRAGASSVLGQNRTSGPKLYNRGPFSRPGDRREAEPFRVGSSDRSGSRGKSLPRQGRSGRRPSRRPHDRGPLGSPPRPLSGLQTLEVKATLGPGTWDLGPGTRGLWDSGTWDLGPGSWDLFWGPRSPRLGPGMSGSELLERGSGGRALSSSTAPGPRPRRSRDLGRAA